MGIKYVEGDILLTSAKCIAHGCNLRGTMGKGIAESLRFKFPEMFKRYNYLCMNKKLLPGMVFISKIKLPWIACLMTQTGYYNAKVEYIEICLKWLFENWDKEYIESIAIPRIGCGLGGLRWYQVKPLYEKYLQPLPIPVYVYDKYIPKQKADEIEEN